MIENLENEIWKPIPEYEELYEVSNLGRVKSLNYRRTDEEKLLKSRINSDGYIMFRLSKNGKRKEYGVHRLKALAFIPIPNELYCYDIKELDVHHKDFNQLNNEIDNLIWMYWKDHYELHAKLEERNKKISTTLRTSEKAIAQRARLHLNNIGRKMSDETKAKVSAANKGKKRPDVVGYLGKVVEGYDDDGNIIHTFLSTMEAGRSGFNFSKVAACCRGERKTHKGLHWRYISQ